MVFIMLLGFLHYMTNLHEFSSHLDCRMRNK